MFGILVSLMVLIGTVWAMYRNLFSRVEREEIET